MRMTITQLRAYLLDNGIDYTIKTIREYASKDIIPVLKHGKPLVFSKEQIDKWIKTKLK